MGPFNMNPQQILQQVMRTPQMQQTLQNNPQAQQYIQVLMNGDAQKGQELARNICGSFGASPEQGVQQAQQYFQNLMQQNPFFRGG